MSMKSTCAISRAWLELELDVRFDLESGSGTSGVSYINILMHRNVVFVANIRSLVVLPRFKDLDLNSADFGMLLMSTGT